MPNKKRLSKTFLTYLLVFTIVPVLLMGGFGLLRALNQFQHQSENVRITFNDGLENELRIEAGNYIRLLDHHHRLSGEGLEKQLIERVGEAYALAADIYIRNVERISEQEIKHKIKETLRPIRYNQGRCYYFIYESDGTAVLTPHAQDLEGQNLAELRDGQDVLMIQGMVDKVKNEGKGLFEYSWYKPGLGDIFYPKVAHVREFEPFDWIIGSGDYPDDVAADTRRDFIDLIANFRLEGDTHLTIMAEDGTRLYSTQQRDGERDNFWETDKGMAVSLMAWAVGRDQNQEFFSTTWERPGGGASNMVFYPVEFKPWGWLVVVGKTQDQVDSLIQQNRENLEERIRKDLLHGLAALLALIAAAWVIAALITQKLEQGLTRFANFFESAASHERTLLEPEQMRFAELEQLAHQALRMVRDRDKAEADLLAKKQELRSANEELERLASIDGLTGIANRRALDLRLEEEWQRAVRQGTCLSIMMMDLDYFKKYNDTYGHQMGDEALRQVAAVIAESARQSIDFPARYGGEEFSVIMPATNLEGASVLAERIRRGVVALNREHKTSEVADHVTISIGIAQVEPHRDGKPKYLVAEADQALYRAKESGRNRYLGVLLENGGRERGSVESQTG